VNAEYREVRAADKEYTAALAARLHQEAAYTLLQTFLGTLPERDKNGALLSLRSLDALERIRRRQKDQLAISRLAVRCSMERAVETNDAFCGPRELMRTVAAFRSIAWVKSFMVWYKFVEQRRLFREIGARIGFGTAEGLKTRVLAALRANVAAKRGLREKMAQASRFMLASSRIRDECFHAWRGLLRLLASVDASKLRAVARASGERGAAALDAWRRVVRNKRKALTLFRSAALLHAFGRWLSLLDGEQEVFEAVQDKLRHLVVEFGDAYVMAVLREWHDVVRKKKLAGSRWAKAALWWAWGEWAELCRETLELLQRVKVQCAGVVAALAGQSRDSSFFAWRQLTAPPLPPLSY